MDIRTIMTLLIPKAIIILKRLLNDPLFIIAMFFNGCFWNKDIIKNIPSVFVVR